MLLLAIIVIGACIWLIKSFRKHYLEVMDEDKNATKENDTLLDFFLKPSDGDYTGGTNVDENINNPDRYRGISTPDKPHDSDCD